MCACVPRVRACSRLMFRQSSPFQFNRLPAQRRWHFVMLCCRPSCAPPRAECYQSVRSNLAARSRADSFERCGRLWSWRTVDGGRRLTIFIINLPSYSTTMERAARKRWAQSTMQIRFEPDEPGARLISVFGAWAVFVNYPSSGSN